MYTAFFRIWGVPGDLRKLHPSLPSHTHCVRTGGNRWRILFLRQVHGVVGANYSMKYCEKKESLPCVFQSQKERVKKQRVDERMPKIIESSLLCCFSACFDKYLAKRINVSCSSRWRSSDEAVYTHILSYIIWYSQIRLGAHMQVQTRVFEKYPIWIWTVLQVRNKVDLKIHVEGSRRIFKNILWW